MPHNSSPAWAALSDYLGDNGHGRVWTARDRHGRYVQPREHAAWGPVTRGGHAGHRRTCAAPFQTYAPTTGAPPPSDSDHRPNRYTVPLDWRRLLRFQLVASAHATAKIAYRADSR